MSVRWQIDIKLYGQYRKILHRLSAVAFRPVTHYAFFSTNFWVSGFSHHFTTKVSSTVKNTKKLMKIGIVYTCTVECRNLNVRNPNNAEIRTFSCSSYMRSDFRHSGCLVCSIFQLDLVCIELNENCSIL